MFGALSLSQLQEYWWFIFAILGALFVFMTFVQGGQTLLHTLGKTELVLAVHILCGWEFYLLLSFKPYLMNTVKKRVTFLAQECMRYLCISMEASAFF